MVWSDIAVFVCLNRQSPFESSLKNRLGQTGHAGTACDGLNWLPPDNIMPMIGCGRASMNLLIIKGWVGLRCIRWSWLLQTSVLPTCSW